MTLSKQIVLPGILTFFISGLPDFDPLTWAVKGDQLMIQWKREFHNTKRKHWCAEDVNLARWVAMCLPYPESCRKLFA